MCLLGRHLVSSRPHEGMATGRKGCRHSVTLSIDITRYLLKIVDNTIAWANTMARYDNEAQREEVGALYQAARDRLAAQL